MEAANPWKNTAAMQAAPLGAAFSPLIEVVGRELAADAPNRRSGPGAHVRAAGKIDANVELMTESPFAAVLVDELASSSSICHHCYLDVDEAGGESCCCGACYGAWYCSEPCRAAALPVHGDSAAGAKDGECSTLKRLRGSFDNTRDARLLCRIQHVRSTLVAAPGGEPASGMSFADLVFHEEAEAAADGEDTVRSTAAETVALANSILPPTLAVISEAEGVNAVLRIRANGFSVLDQGGGGAGIGVYLAGAYYNHSCVPNVCVTYAPPHTTPSQYDLKRMGTGRFACDHDTDKITTACADRNRGNQLVFRTITRF